MTGNVPGGNPAKSRKTPPLSKAPSRSKPAENNQSVSDRLRDLPTLALAEALCSRIVQQSDRSERTLLLSQFIDGKYETLETSGHGGCFLTPSGDYRKAMVAFLMFVTTRLSPGDRLRLDIRGGAR